MDSIERIALLFVVILVYGISIVLAVATSQRSHTDKSKRLWATLCKALPYSLSIIAAFSFRTHGLWEVVGGAVVFVVLTWVVLWGAKKQWSSP